MTFNFKHLLKYFYNYSPQFPFSFWATIALCLGISSFYFIHQSLALFLFLLFFYTIFAKPQNASIFIYSSFIISFFLGLIIITLHNKPFFTPGKYNVKIKSLIEGKNYTSDSFWKYKTHLKVTSMFYNNTWNKINPFYLCLYTQKPCFGLPDDTIFCTIKEIKLPQDPDMMKYFQREGIQATAFEKDFYTKRLHRPAFSIKRWIFLQKNKINFSLRKKMSPQAFTFFSSLFFGNRHQVQKKLSLYKDSFKQWGVMHYLARSGLHLVLFIFIFQFFLNYIPLSFFIKHLLLLLIVSLYTLYTWNSLSFLRALLVFVFYTFSFLVNKPIYGIHILSCVCFLLLCVNPFHLFFLDFQLSFLLSFALLAIMNAKQNERVVLNKILQQKNKFS